MLLISLSFVNLFLSVIGAPTNENNFKLIVLHNNDMHARFVQTNSRSGKCSHEQISMNLCVGGFARVASIVQKTKTNEENVIFLNAGDTYQGTIWYSIHKWSIVAKFIQMIGLDAMSLGNHEFDDGVAGLLPFVENITVPVLGANLIFTNEPRLGELVKPSTILTVGGRKVGVIGYITPETKDISNPGNVSFTDEIPSIKKEAQKLKSEGVNIIIALGHSGFGMDKKIAKEVEDIDLVIGGHTNTFLYSGNQPDSDVPVGLYPTMIVQSSGRQVPVVSAYAFTKYMGRIELTFDNNGEVIHHQGNPILLDKTVPQDEGVLTAMKPWNEKIEKIARTDLGRTRVYLNGSQAACRMMECNMGNLIADAYVQYNAWLRLGTLVGWTDAPIGIIHGGGIRGSIDEKLNNGTVTMEDLISVLPFQDSVVSLRMQGKHIMQMLEYSVMTYDKTGIEASGRFLQVSGLQVTYDLNNPPGSRVVTALVRCADCRVPRYTPVENSKMYGILTNTFLADGGEGYTMLKNNAERKSILEATESDIVADYLKRKSPVAIGLENRIRLLNADAAAATVQVSIILLVISATLHYL